MGSSGKAVRRGEIKMVRGGYLLAVGLLTGLIIPASTLPHLVSIRSQHSKVVSKTKEGSHLTVSEKIDTTTQNSLAEFRNWELPAVTEPSLNQNSQAVYTRQAKSGSQLYHERLQSLKAGQIYTRISDENLEALRASPKKHQLTYEDWKSLLVMEAKAMAKGQGNNLLGILVGDSLSLWFPKERLPTTKLWLNQGISGDTSTGILKRLSAFAKTKPDVIYIMAGINDLRQGASDEKILHNHYEIIRYLRRTHPRTQIIIQSILPTRLSTIPNNRIRQLNYQLFRIAKKEGAYYLNLYNWFADFEGNLRVELTTDGLHLSKDGYEVWQAALKQVETELAYTKHR
jgi:lysophospholipase L1-like esterase